MSLEMDIAPSKAKSAALLFEPIRVGRMMLPHRVAMAPLTRSRARQPGNVPTPLNAAYYVQRASAALIISEATQVSMQGQGYAWTPGIHSREQIEGWRLVTDAVRAAGGRIFLQLWHVGRISHPALQPDGMLPVAPSAIRPAGQAFIENDRGEGELVPFVTPRALDLVEMPYIVQQYERAAAMLWPQASMASRFTRPMATCWTSSSIHRRMPEPTPMAARSEIVRVCCSKWSRRSRAYGEAIASEFACRRSARSTTSAIQIPRPPSAQSLSSSRAKTSPIFISSIRRRPTLTRAASRIPVRSPFSI